MVASGADQGKNKVWLWVGFIVMVVILSFIWLALNGSSGSSPYKTF